MTKNNLKIVKSNKNQETEGKEKQKALNAAISQIDENFGKGSVMKLGQQAALDIESISTGSLSLDLALGIGGLPKGRVVEIYGPESSGKTTLALQVRAAEIANEGIIAEYESGSERTTLEVIQSSSVLLDSRIDLAVAEKNFLISQLNLLSSIGRLTARHLNLK